MQAQILDNRNDPAGTVAEQRSLAILRPIAEAPEASVAVRRAYVESLVRAGFEENSANQYAAAIPLLEHAMQLAQDLGARNLADVDMAAYYAEAGAWYATCLVSLGRDAAARRVGDDVFAVADQVLALRPGYRLALHAEQVVAGSLSAAAQNALDPAEMLRISKRDEQVSLTLLQLDPHNVTSLNNLGVAQSTIGDALWGAGRLRDSIPFYQKAVDDYGRAAAGGATFAITQAASVLGLAISQAQMGDTDGAAASIAAEAPYLDRLRAGEPQGSLSPRLVENIVTIAGATIALERDDLAEARRMAQGAVQQLHSAKTVGTFQANQVAITSYYGLHVAGRADYLLGNYTAAEQAERQALEARTHWSTEGVSDQRYLKELSTWLTMALAKQGKLAEAAQEIAPVVRYQRELKARNRGEVWQPAELAAALYAQALTDPGRRAPLLKEAAALLDATPPTLRGLHDIRLWRGLISAAQRGS
jgi:tetratricopeptide (TPR) repeat protein